MPGGNRPGNWPGLNGSQCLLLSSSKPKMIWAILPSAPGRARYAPGFAVKALANANRRASPGMPALIASQVALVAKVIGIADAAGAVANTGCILFSGLDEAGRAAIPKHVSRPDVLGFAFTMACRVKPAMARTAAASQLARAHAKPVCLSHSNSAGLANPLAAEVPYISNRCLRPAWAEPTASPAPTVKARATIPIDRLAMLRSFPFDPLGRAIAGQEAIAMPLTHHMPLCMHGRSKRCSGREHQSHESDRSEEISCHHRILSLNRLPLPPPQASGESCSRFRALGGRG